MHGCFPLNKRETVAHASLKVILVCLVQSLPNCAASIRNAHQQCPREVLTFLLDLFKYSDNQDNKVSGLNESVGIYSCLGVIASFPILAGNFSPAPSILTAITEQISLVPWQRTLPQKYRSCKLKSENVNWHVLQFVWIFMS